jgi:hypothetical protein
MMTHLLRPLLALGISALATPAWAQDVPAAAEAPAEPACASLSTALTAINAALDEALLDEAEALADDARRSLLCQPEPVPAMVINAIFSLKGAVHIFQGKEKAAEEAFEWAVAVSPLAPLDAMLGARPIEAYNRVRDDVLARPVGTLHLQGDAKVWVDGRSIPIGSPVELPAGPHLLQWQKPGKPMKGRIISVASGEVRTLPVGKGGAAASNAAVSEAAVSEAAALPSPTGLTQRRNLYLASGGGLVAAGGGLLVAGLTKRGQVDGGEFEDLNELDELASSANALGALGMASAALGAGLLGVGLVTTEATTTVVLRGRF